MVYFVPSERWHRIKRAGRIFRVREKVPSAAAFIDYTHLIRLAPHVAISKSPQKFLCNGFALPPFKLVVEAAEIDSFKFCLR